MTTAADALLSAALREAPRRYRMPPLPASVAAASAQGAEAALAYAIEAARLAALRGVPADGEVKALFRESLAQLIHDALRPEGDASFQALVLRQESEAVREHLRLAAQRRADEKAVRAAIDALAHPGKPRNDPVPPEWVLRRESMLQGDWLALAPDARLLPDDAAQALRRLARAQALLAHPDLLRHAALAERQGPGAGSSAAREQGSAAARAGASAEAATALAFTEIARMLDALAPGHRVARGLRTPRGFPGDSHKAKDEWDAAILRAAGEDDAADIVLLAEVKAAPSAATSDFSRLHRGLERLSHASARQSYAFESADGDVRVAGESLARLRPQGRMLPKHVIYCSTSPPEPAVPMLAAASRAVLLSEPASVAFAMRLGAGGAPSAEELDAIWLDLAHAPRLKSVLHQYETSRAVREAMLHPQDLLEAVRRSRAAD